MNRPPPPWYNANQRGILGTPPRHQQNQFFFHQQPPPQGPYGYQPRGYLAHAHDQYASPGYHTPAHQGPSPTSNTQVSRDQLNAVAKDCIDRLVDAKEHVSVERIEKLILDYYGVENIHALGVRHVEHIQCVRENVHLQTKINGYIQAFIRIRVISTIYELHEHLRDYTTDRQDFESFKLGPLIKHPMVYDYFKFPQDAEVLEIGTNDVLDHLQKYLTENNMWHIRVETNELLTYMAQAYHVETPFSLGIRIKSVPLAVGLLKKSQKDMRTDLKKALSSCSDSAEAEIKAGFDDFIRSLVGQENGMCKVRKELMKMSSAKAVDQVFSKFKVLLRSISYSRQTEAKKIGLTKKISCIEQFTNILKRDGLLNKMFQTVICCSWEELHISLHSLISEFETGVSSEEKDTPGNEKDDEEERERPPVANVVKQIKHYLERCFVNGSLDLSHLCRIENKLLEEFGQFTTFKLLTDTTFLDFVTNNEEVKNYLEENGGVVLGSQQSGRSGSGYRASLCDLQDFIIQSALVESSMESMLERALSWHYQVSEAKMLGHGSLSSLQSGALKAQRQHTPKSVYFESALCAKESRNLLGVGRGKVGLLGLQTREAALLSLYNCPLLEDLAEWSHWDLVFKPELGELKDFIRKNSGVQTFSLPNDPGRSVMTKIVAVETRPGQLLKLTADTSNEAFADAAGQGDVRGTCGHLVSLVTSNKGVSNTPLALLANHFKTGLLKIQGSNPSSCEFEAEGDDSAITLGRFVVQCLTWVPFVTCQAVANQVFLEPLTSVVGQTKSRNLLLQCVGSMEEENRLQLLGLLLGIDQWSASIQDRLQPPEQHLQHPTHPTPDTGACIVIDSDKEEPSVISSEVEDESDADDEIAITKIVQSTAPPAEQVIVDICDSTEDSDLVEMDGEECVKSDEKDEGEKEEEKEEESESPYLGVIDDIRRSEFGINVTLSAEAQKLMEKQQERQGRSLDRLSDELYSKDTHFVLELIQNADDNNYGSDITPAIKFVVEKDQIIVLNNEKGFNESNIRAICDIGKSTKGKHKAGYIGQKGIGFKSVFRVTDRPTIHSGGYHFMFDKSTGPIGYILPHWTTEKNDYSNKWDTSIILPLKEDVQQPAKLRQLAARFQDVHPSILLFLHRLRSITILNKIGDYRARMERTDIGDHIIEVKHMVGADKRVSKTDRWIVVKKTLDASSLSVQAKSGVEVESTEIALAFPMHEVESLQTQALPPKQPVFAFLPLRTYGFRFVIQGDFDVPSSREDICHDSMWNQWLQSEIHRLFVDSLEVFKKQRNLSPIDALCLFIKFLPIEDEVLDFFRPVASQIVQRLRSQPCLPTAPSAPGAPLEWRLPSQLILVTDPLLQQVASPDVLQSQLGLTYLHPDLGSRINPSLLTSLGVQTLNTTHLIEIGRALSIQLSQSTELERESLLTQIGKWFAALFRSMDEINVDKKGLSLVKDLPLLPLSNGTIVTLNMDGIFFPLDTEERREADKRKDLLLYLEQDLNMVSPHLFSHLDEMTRPQVWRTLEILGVRKLLPADIIKHHIIPSLRQLQKQAESETTNKPSGLLISYLIFIKEELDRQPHLVTMEELGHLALVMTNQGFKRPEVDSVHFPKPYLNKVDLLRDLPGFDWVLVDPVYLERCKTNLEIQTWRHFLMKLGVVDGLSVKPETVTVTHQDIADSAWAKYEPLLPKSEKEFTLVDYECPEFMALVMENSKKNTLHKQMQVLFDHLDACWESDYSQYVVTHVRSLSGQDIVEVETTFGMMLKQLPWVPYIQKSARNNIHYSETKRGEMQGEQLFLQCMVMERLLAHHVPYLDPQQTPRSQLSTFLQVRDTLTPDTLLDLLIQWSARSAINQPKVFTTSLSHMKAVYTSLQEKLPPKQLQDVFHDHPVIFVPDVSPGELVDPQRCVEGTMLSRGEVRWEDPSKLFIKYKGALELRDLKECIKPSLCVWYRDQEQLMIHSARITRHPALSERAELIIAIAATHPVLSVISDIMRIYMDLGVEIEDGKTSEQAVPSEVSQLIQKIKQHSVLPSKDNKWKKVSDKPLIADDRQMERLFSEKGGVSFLTTDNTPVGRRLHRLPRGSHHSPDAVVSLYKALGIESLSEVLTAEYVTESFTPCLSLHVYIVSVLPYIQACLYSQFADIYEAHVRDGIADKIKRMKFVQVGRLEVVYRLKPFPDIAAALGETCKLKDNKDEFTFYVHQDHVTATYEVNKELSRYFSRSNETCLREIKNLLIELMPLVRYQSPALKYFMDHQGIQELPNEEKRWEAPSVERPPSPPPQPLPPGISEAAVSQPDRPSQQSGDRVMTCWPPRSNPVMTGMAAGMRGPPPKSIWPPPAPTNQPSRPDFTSVPSNIRPASSNINPANEQSTSDTRNLPQSCGDPRAFSGGTGHPLGHPGGPDSRMMPSGDPGAYQYHGGYMDPRGNGHPNGSQYRGPGNDWDRPNMDGEMPMVGPLSGRVQVGGKRYLQEGEEGSMEPGLKRRRHDIEHIGAPPREHLWFDLPEWTCEDVEQTLAEKEWAAQMPTELILEDEHEDSSAERIGRWGEHLVYNYLLTLKDSQNSQVAEVVWVNEKEERGFPYDIKVSSYNQDNQTLEDVFVEVKATRSDKKAFFPISFNELNLAFEKKEAYHLFRVYNAGKQGQVRLTRVENLAAKIEKKMVRLCLVI